MSYSVSGWGLAEPMKTDAHVLRLRREFASTGKVGVASLRADMCRQTGAKWLHAGVVPSGTKKPRAYSTWPNGPFATVDDYIDGYLERFPGIHSTDMMRLLEIEHAGRFSGSLRTLQRRVKSKRARSQSKELFFAQIHRPGEWMQVDWADMKDMGITIGGAVFEHKVCHGVFAFSSVEHVSVCESESFASLEMFMHGAALRFGGLPSGIQLDNSSAVTKRVVSSRQERVFTDRFQSMLDHYGLKARTINVRKPNENGCAEVSHSHFRHHLEVALMVRESKDFESEDAYREFVEGVVRLRNSSRHDAWKRECEDLSPVPTAKLKHFHFERRKVNFVCRRVAGLPDFARQCIVVPRRRLRT